MLRRPPGPSQSEFYKSIAEIPPSHLSRMLALSDILHSAEIEAETLRREKILDECRFSLLRALRRDVLEQLRPGSASHPTQPEQIGRLANGLLEIDKQLRKTLLSFGQAEKLAMDALVALTEGMDDPSLQKTLGNIVQRVRGVVESFPSDPMTRGGRR